jgi:hypothetical protein
MKEITVEEYLAQRVRELGGWTFKFAPVSFVGVPDRIVLLPGGRCGFLELKRPGERPRANQLGWIRRLCALGFLCDWVDSKVGVDQFLGQMQRSSDTTK